jgi:hypothetical protein
MFESVSFAVILLILFAWIASWSLIGAVVAAGRGHEAISGVVLGMMFGPIGVLFVAVQGSRSVSRPARRHEPTTRPVAAHDRRPRGGVFE